jgi:hypothetical protein
MNSLYPGDILDLIVMPISASVFVGAGSCAGLSVFLVAGLYVALGESE